MRFSKALFAISAVAVAALTVMLLSNIARADVESPAPYQYYRTTQSFKISMMGSSQKVPVPSGVVVRAQKRLLIISCQLKRSTKLILLQ